MESIISKINGIVYLFLRIQSMFLKYYTTKEWKIKATVFKKFKIYILGFVSKVKFKLIMHIKKNHYRLQLVII